MNLFFIFLLNGSLFLMGQSGNPEAFWIEMRDQQQSMKWQTNCQWELKNKSFPDYCLKYYSDLLDQPDLIKLAHEVQIKMNQSCLKYADRVLSPSRLQVFLKSPWISLGCRSRVQNRLEDLRYQKSAGVGTDIELFFGREDP